MHLKTQKAHKIGILAAHCQWREKFTMTMLTPVVDWVSDAQTHKSEVDVQTGSPSGHTPASLAPHPRVRPTPTQGAHKTHKSCIPVAQCTRRDKFTMTVRGRVVHLVSAASSRCTIVRSMSTPHVNVDFTHCNFCAQPTRCTNPRAHMRARRLRRIDARNRDPHKVHTRPTKAASLLRVTNGG